MNRKSRTSCYSSRLSALPPYLFDRLDKMKNEEKARGTDIIDLGIGDTDLPTPEKIIRRLQKEVASIDNHHYPPYSGIKGFREAISDWCEKRYGHRPDPDREVLVTIGSKEGIAHIFLAYINPGDIALCPDPAYPVYNAGTIFAGGTPFVLPLDPGRRFLPDLDAVPREVAGKAKMLFVNYPNNPTAATMDHGDMKAMVDYCRKWDIVLCSDAAYSELVFDGYDPPGLLRIEGGMDVGVEFHSLSKTYNMTGWRLGFLVGNREVISGLRQVKTNVDSGVFSAIQWAGVEALTNCDEEVRENIRIFEERRDVFAEKLSALGWKFEKPRGTFYLWTPVPEGYDSMGFSRLLLETCGIVATPGVGFGPIGEGYVRFALTVGKERLEEAADRIRRL